MQSDIIATYSHDDRQVRFLMRYSFLTGLLSGGSLCWLLAQIFH